MVAVVQLVERQFVVLDVAGSSPVGHPNRAVGGTQVPLHCSGPGFCPGDAPLAQRQSNGLLIRRFWVRNPGGAPLACLLRLMPPSGVSADWVKLFRLIGDTVFG